jgi:hypothetical protein
MPWRKEAISIMHRREHALRLGQAAKGAKNHAMKEWQSLGKEWRKHENRL